MRLRTRSGMAPLARRREAVAVMLATALGLFATGCDCSRSTPTRAWKADAGALNQPPTEVQLRVRTDRIPGQAPPPLAVGPSPAIKVEPALEARAAARPDDIETLLITFRDPFAGNADTVHAYAGNPAAPDTGKLAATNMARALRTRRATELHRWADSLELRHGAVVLPDRFAFTHALLARMKLKEIATVALMPEVIRIDPVWGEGPPQASSCGTSADVLAKAGGLLGSERYLAAGHGSGTIKLLDTGVHAAHALLGAPPLSFQLDCITNPSVCQDGDTGDDVWPSGHGTASSAILAATGAMGDPNSGLTQATIESYRVYGIPPGETEVKVNYPGSAVAFDNLLLDDADIVVAEIATAYGGYGPLTQAAGWAFDRGAVVVAPNGNWNSRLLPQPANSPRALGVGMYCMQALATFRSDATWGTTPDNRTKPDLGAPTGAYTASVSAYDPSKLATYGGTSGAAPMVGAAALLLRNWMRSGGAVVSPGHVYAMLLACGQGGNGHTMEGAGRIQLPSGGLAWWGSFGVSNGKTFTLGFDTGNLAASGIEAAIWWPEYGTGGGGIPSVAERASISLRALDPAGHPSELSGAAGTVFQKVKLSRGAGVKGNVWRLELGGAYVPGAPREVYYALWARP